MSDLDREVVESLQKHEILSSNTDQDYRIFLRYFSNLTNPMAT